MEYFTIRNFRPIEAKESATDQDRSVMRLCEGVLPFPQGALCAGPEWKSLWGLNELGTEITNALTGDTAATDKAHFVTVSKNGHTFLVCWSLDQARPLGFFYVGGSNANSDLDETGSVTITATAGAVYRDKHASKEWFASHIAGRIILGNGTDENLVWYDGALSILGPNSQPADLNKRSRVRIPPCTCFRQHVNRSIFATGNETQPLRVWITDAPNVGEPFVDGIYSLQTSYIDVHPHGGATRNVALAVFMQYVVVHTDKAPVNLYGVDNSTDGWKCLQSPSAANASAINPNCVGDANGDAAFYLGSDLEVYQDQAIRSGPFEKRGARAQEIVTEQGAGEWNEQAKFPLLTYGYHTVYDRNNRLFWMFMPNSIDSRPALFVFNERTRSVAGPWRYPAAVVSTVMTSLGQSIVVAITASGECLYADLGAIGEVRPENIEATGTALGAGYAILEAEPTLAGPPPPGPEPEPDPTALVSGLPYVAMTADNATFIETLLKPDSGKQSVGLANAWAPLTSLAEGSYTLTQWFANAYLARFEFPWQDLGGPVQFKNFLEVELTLERAGRAYVGIYAETDAGRRGGRWKGIIHPKEKVRIPLNLWGKAIRLRVVAVCFNSGRFLIRNIRIGYTVGGSD